MNNEVKENFTVLFTCKNEKNKSILDMVYFPDTQELGIYTVKYGTHHVDPSIRFTMLEFLDLFNNTIKFVAKEKLDRVLEDKIVDIEEDMQRYGPQSKLLVYEKDVLKDLSEELTKAFSDIYVANKKNGI